MRNTYDLSESADNWPITNGKTSFLDIFQAIKGTTGILPSVKIYNTQGSVIGTFSLADIDKYKISVTCEGEDQRDIVNSLRVAGFLDLTFTHTKSKDPFSSASGTKKIQENDFQTWFQALINGKTLVPDTNSILNHTFSSLSRIFGYSILQNARILIPRLVILEMERLANSKQNIDCSNPSSEKDKCYCKNKRATMLGYEEIMFLKHNSADVFPDLDAEILARFTQIAGDLTSDSWIRREIKDYVPNAIRRKMEKGGSSITGTPPQFILVSSDLVNSLSASAEGIDSMYIARPFEFTTRSGSLEQLTKFLIYHSTTTGHLKVDIGLKQYEIRGFWSGKTTHDILNDRIMIKNTVQ